MDSDDEIELLKSPPSEASESDTQLQASINPSLSLQSRGSAENSTNINRGSLLALQTAFNSLHKKNNELTTKYQELEQRHKLMQKSVVKESVMDPLLANDMAAGAGASHNEEAMDNTAEARASQGYIQHLERGLLRSHNSLAKCNNEIERLKSHLSEMEQFQKTWMKDKEALQSDINNLADSLELAREESAKKDETIFHLEETLRNLTVHNQSLQEENIGMKRRAEDSERTVQNLHIKDSEIREFRTKLSAADSEIKRLKNSQIDLEKRLSNKNLEISALEAKYKQYAIENDINRKHVQAQAQRGSDSFDDVDGEAEMIKRAFDLVKNQTDTIHILKSKVDQQKSLITELCKNKAVKFESESISPFASKMSDIREAAQGASFHPQMEEKPVSPQYMNHSPRLMGSPLGSPRLPPNVKQVTPASSLSRLSNDQNSLRRDVQSSGSGTHDLRKPLTVSPRTNDSVLPVIVSPRISDAVKPTGNTNVPRMIASEQSQPQVCLEERNVMDALRPAAVSPQGRIGNFVKNESPDYNLQNLGEYDMSQRTIRKSSPNHVRDDHDQTGIMNVHSPKNYGARPRVQPSDSRQSYSKPNLAQMTLDRIPDRMTQSEIILRGNPTGNNDYNFGQPVPPLDIPSSGSRSLEDNNHQGHGQMHESTLRFHHRSASQPDYENVYENRKDKEYENPLNDYDHSIYVNNADILMQQSGRTPVEHRQQAGQAENENMNSVSALKICPSCSVEFSRLTMDQFQRHVFECFDTFEESPPTLQPEVAQSDEDRTCPMCGATFPLTVAQEAYEQHVLAHFGEEPLIDGFDMLIN